MVKEFIADHKVVSWSQLMERFHVSKVHPAEEASRLPVGMHACMKNIKSECFTSAYAGLIEMKCPDCGKEVKTPMHACMHLKTSRKAISWR